MFQASQRAFSNCWIPRKRILPQRYLAHAHDGIGMSARASDAGPSSHGRGQALAGGIQRDAFDLSVDDQAIFDEALECRDDHTVPACLNQLATDVQSTVKLARVPARGDADPAERNVRTFLNCFRCVGATNNCRSLKFRC